MDMAAALQKAKNCAAQAKARKCLQRSRHDQQRQQYPSGGLETGEKQHDGGTRQGGPDALGETLGRTGNELGVPDPGPAP